MKRTIKVLLSVFMSLSLLMTSGCSSKPSIVGKWEYLRSHDITFYEFFDDGKYYDAYEDVAGEYTLSEDSLVLTDENGETYYIKIELQDKIMKWDWENVTLYTPELYLVEESNVEPSEPTYEDVVNDKVFFDVYGDDIEIDDSMHDGSMDKCPISPYEEDGAWFSEFEAYYLKNSEEAYTMYNSCRFKMKYNSANKKWIIYDYNMVEALGEDSESILDKHIGKTYDIDIKTEYPTNPDLTFEMKAKYTIEGYDDENNEYIKFSLVGKYKPTYSDEFQDLEYNHCMTVIAPEGENISLNRDLFTNGEIDAMKVAYQNDFSKNYGFYIKEDGELYLRDTCLNNDYYCISK